MHAHTHTEKEELKKAKIDSMVQRVFRYNKEIKTVTKYQDVNFLRQKLSREFSELLSPFIILQQIVERLFFSAHYNPYGNEMPSPCCPVQLFCTLGGDTPEMQWERVEA